MTEPLAAIVLAGGKSQRLGEPKPLVRLGDLTLIERVLGALAPLAQELLVVVASPEQAEILTLPPEARVVVDRQPGLGPLGGLYSGLLASPRPWCLAVACDMPFLNRSLLAHMAALAPGFDAVVPRPGGKLQPLHALYSRACLAAIEHCLQEGERKADAFLSAVSVRHVEDEEIAPLDPQWRSFFNVNSRDDLAQAQVVLLSSAAGSTAT